MVINKLFKNDASFHGWYPKCLYNIYIYGTHFVIFYHHSSIIFTLYFQYGIIFHWLIIQLSNHCGLKCKSCGFKSLCLLQVVSEQEREGKIKN